MPLQQYLKGAIACCAFFVASSSLLLAASHRPTLTVLYYFHGLQDGGNPMAGLTFDSSGNLYGTAVAGGNFEACAEGGPCGVVFELSPQNTGNWMETVLYDFQNEDPNPPTSNLVFDSAGNLYGATGGLDDAGLVPSLFQLEPSNGTWNLNVVYGNDLAGQIAAPILDPHGNLYTTVAGDSENCCGFVLELSPKPDGTWLQTTLYQFLGESDGADPLGGVIADRAGNLYGTTAFSASSPPCGTVFELSPQANGWTETTLYTFVRSVGCYPTAGLVRDAQGNLYGTTEFGGVGPCSPGCGVVFELSPPAQKGGAWTESTLHRFALTDGYYPYAGLAIDSSGDLYGTTIRGGNGPCEPTGGGCGTVFRLTPPSQPGGAWTHTYYSFQGTDGIAPYGTVLLDERHGVLYGTASAGGAYQAGSVFEIAP